MLAKIIMLTLVFVGITKLFKWAIKAWKNADVDDKLQDQKDTSDISKKIKKKSSPSSWRDKKHVEKFLNK
jgi:hypothetical protein